MSEVNSYIKVVRFQSQSKVHELNNSDKAKENHTPNSSERRKVIYGPDLVVTVNNKTRQESPRFVEVNDYKAIPYHIELEECEKKRRASVKKELSARQSQYDNFDQQLEKERKENLKKSKLNHFNKTKDIENCILNELEQVDRRYMHENELKKREQCEKREKQLKKNQQIEVAKNWNQIQKFLTNFNKAHENLINRFKSKDFNKILYKNFNSQLDELCKSRDQLLKSIKTHGITTNDVTTAEQLYCDIENLNSNYDVEYDKLVKKIADDNEKLQQLQLQEQHAAEKLMEEQKAKDEVDNNNQLSTISINPNLGFLSFVSKECFEFYTNLQLLLQKYSEIIAPLLNDDSLKKYRFDCQKAINIPVNAISAVNSQHLIDKYEKLSTLLSGNTVKIGENNVSANSYPTGKQFCMFLLAKKFVQQADTQISSNPKAAFPVAAVIVALWQKFPEFGVLFLGHLHKECPYMVPYFIPQFEGQSTEEYLRLVGYHYVDGVLENQDLYLKRLSGIIRLYSAILITKPRREFMNLPHPHNLDHGWKWITNLLNLDPLPDICATLILEFLQITGSYFIKNYGKQFIKLLKFIHEKYFIKLNKIDEGGPKARLEGFLMKIFKDGIIQPPEGVLNDNFW